MHAGTAEPVRVSPPEAVAYPVELEDVQLAAGHADPSTTKLYDRRGYNPEKASFFANY